MKKLKCIILDDEKGPRERLAVLLSKMDVIELIAVEEKPESAINTIMDQKPDLVFIDVEMPRMSGFDVVKKVHARIPDQDFVFVTGYNQYAIKAIKNQAFDFLIKPVDIDELKDTIERFRNRLATNQNRPTLNPEIVKLFTERELEILSLIGQHKTAAEIAESLYLSKHTVDTHRKNIAEKTGLHKFSELVVFARENGLL